MGTVLDTLFDTITEWLKKHIHQHGCLKEPSDRIRAIAGRELNAGYYVEYLNNKFTGIYG